MSQFTSTIQILKVDAPEEKEYDGRKFTVRTAQCALLTDDGEIDKVGRLSIPDNLVDQCKVGVFRGAFALEVGQFGKQKGDVRAVLTALQPVPTKTAPRASATS